MAKRKFKDLSKKDKIFKIINLIFMWALFVTTVALTIYFVCIGDPKNRLMAGIGVAIVAVAPWLIELIFRTRLPNVLFLGIEFYLVVAGLWGSVLSGYTQFAWLDIVVHAIMGYLCTMLGIFLISRVTDYKKMKPLAVILFCFCFSMAVELVWELSEWFADIFLNQAAQGPIAEGFNAPLVTDTMEDILCNFCGSIVFVIHFVIGKFSKCSLGIKTIEGELAKGYKNELEKEEVIEIAKPEQDERIETTDVQEVKEVLKEEIEPKKQKKTNKKQ